MVKCLLAIIPGAVGRGTFESAWQCRYPAVVHIPMRLSFTKFSLGVLSTMDPTELLRSK